MRMNMMDNMHVKFHQCYCVKHGSALQAQSTQRETEGLNGAQMRWRFQFQFDTRCSKRATRLVDQTSWRFDPDRLCGLHDFVHSSNSCVKLRI